MEKCHAIFWLISALCILKDSGYHWISIVTNGFTPGLEHLPPVIHLPPGIQLNTEFNQVRGRQGHRPPLVKCGVAHRDTSAMSGIPQ